MMKTRSVILAIPVVSFLLFCFFCLSIAQSPPGSCLNCHADETVLKPLVKARVEAADYG